MSGVSKMTLDLCMQAREIKESLEDILMMEKRGKTGLPTEGQSVIKFNLDRTEEALKKFWRS